MVSEQSEGVTCSFPFGKNPAGTVEKPVSVCVVVKDGAAGDAPHHQMVDCAGGINAGMSWYEEIVSAGDS